MTPRVPHRHLVPLPAGRVALPLGPPVPARHPPARPPARRRARSKQ